MVDWNILADNQVNIFTIVYSPESVSHQTSYKKVQILNALLVGRSEHFNCSLDSKPNDLNFHSANSIRSFAAGISNNGMIGLSWSNFISDSNGAPNNAWFI